MEPFAIQSATPGLFRPGLELSGDLSAVLREGRVLSGEVLQTLGGGTVLIGVGRHRVPARTDVRMQPGHKFLFQVEGQGDARTLVVLDGAAALEPRLLVALRAARGGGALGGALGELVALLRGGGPAAEALADGLAEHAFQPRGAAGQATGEALSAKLLEAGRGYEGRLAERALGFGPAGPSGSTASAHPALAASTGTTSGPGLGSELASLLRAELGGTVTAEALAGALKRGLGVEAGADGAALERILARFSPAGSERLDLRGLLASALEGLAGGPQRAELLARLDGALPDSLGRGLDGALLRGLLGLGAGGEPKASAEGLLAELGGDLKARLLRSLAGLEEGPVRRALLSVLEGLEHEQLLNLARRSAGEPQYLGLPVLDGERWTTAHLFVHGRGKGKRRSREHAQRLTVAVDFRHTGPVRAELVVGREGLAARISVGREDVLARMRASAGQLEQRLALGGRGVQLSFALAEAADLDTGRELTDIRFLREHHLLDRSG